MRTLSNYIPEIVIAGEVEEVFLNLLINKLRRFRMSVKILSKERAPVNEWKEVLGKEIRSADAAIVFIPKTQKSVDTIPEDEVDCVLMRAREDRLFPTILVAPDTYNNPTEQFQSFIQAAFLPTPYEAERNFGLESNFRAHTFDVATIPPLELSGKADEIVADLIDLSVGQNRNLQYESEIRERNRYDEYTKLESLQKDAEQKAALLEQAIKETRHRRFNTTMMAILGGVIVAVGVIFLVFDYQRAIDVDSEPNVFRIAILYPTIIATGAILAATCLNRIQQIRQTVLEADLVHQELLEIIPKSQRDSEQK